MKELVFISSIFLSFLMGVIFATLLLREEPCPVAKEPKEYEYNPEFRLSGVDVTWVSGSRDVRKKLDEHLEDTGVFAVGLTSYNEEKQKCTIYATEPSGEYLSIRKAEILGHELLHCFRGNFHD